MDSNGAGGQPADSSAASAASSSAMSSAAAGLMEEETYVSRHFILDIKLCFSIHSGVKALRLSKLRTQSKGVDGFLYGSCRIRSAIPAKRERMVAGYSGDGAHGSRGGTKHDLLHPVAWFTLHDGCILRLYLEMTSLAHTNKGRYVYRALCAHDYADSGFRVPRVVQAFSDFAGTAHSSKRRRDLSSLFAPPVELLFPAGFDQVRTKEFLC